MSGNNLIEHLLQPGKIGTMELKNRVIYAGMTFKLADGKGRFVKSEVDRCSTVPSRNMAQG